MSSFVTQKWRCSKCSSTQDSPFSSCPDCGESKASTPICHCEKHGDLEGASCPVCERVEQRSCKLAEARQAVARGLLCKALALCDELDADSRGIPEVCEVRRQTQEQQAHHLRIEESLRDREVVGALFLCRSMASSTTASLTPKLMTETKDQICHILMVLEGMWILFRTSTGSDQKALDDAFRRLDMKDGKSPQQAAGEAAVIVQDVNRLFLMSHAMWTLMKDRCGLTDKQLLDAVQEIDLRDGKCDGKVAAGSPRPCRACGRMLSRKAFVCMYCGAAVEREMFQP